MCGNLVWPGDPDATSVFPQDYVIDCVRVWQRECRKYWALPLRFWPPLVQMIRDRRGTPDRSANPGPAARRVRTCAAIAFRSRLPATLRWQSSGIYCLTMTMWIFRSPLGV